MKSILVLGSDGQIGSALVEYLREGKYAVGEFDIAKNEFQDLRKPGILDAILPTTDFVIFLAFDVGGSTYLKKYQNTKTFVDNNLKILLNTFESLEKHKTPFIFASSQMANMDYSNYGILKSLGEKYTQILGGLLVKFWNVYGLEKDPAKFHVITDFIKAAKKDGKIAIKTSGQESRQFLHADDCSAALEILMRKYNEIPRDKNLHITSFEWNSIIEVAKIVCKISKVEYTVGAQEDIQLDKKNWPDPYILYHWKPQISLEEGIEYIYNNT